MWGFFGALILLLPPSSGFTLPGGRRGGVAGWVRVPRTRGGAIRAEMVGRTPICGYREVTVRTSKETPPQQEISIEELTGTIETIIRETGLQEGHVTVTSRHTTTAVTINEWEQRLVRDVAAWLLQLAPPDDRSPIGRGGGGIRYLHNDINERPDGADEHQRCLDNGWDVGDPEVLEVSGRVGAYCRGVVLLLIASQHWHRTGSARAVFAARGGVHRSPSTPIHISFRCCLAARRQFQ